MTTGVPRRGRGFRGIVVTLDTWVTGWRPRDLAASNFPQLRGHCLANNTSDPVFRARPEADLIMAVDGYPTLADLTPAGLRRTCDHG